MKHRVFATCALALLTLLPAGAAESGSAKSGIRIDLDAAEREAQAKQKPASKSAQPAASTAKPAAKKEAAKKEDAPAKIAGQEVSRGERGFLGISVDGGFKVAFYDRNRKPVAPDVAQIAVRWPVKYQPNDERALLTPAGENVMASAKVVRPPYHFKLYVTLLKGEAAGDTAVPETYVIDFNQ